MNLNQFLNEHFEDYIYLYKASTGEHITDVAVKFIPFWILKTYGNMLISVELDLTVAPEKKKYSVFNVWVKDNVQND